MVKTINRNIPTSGSWRDRPLTLSLAFVITMHKCTAVLPLVVTMESSGYKPPDWISRVQRRPEPLLPAGDRRMLCHNAAKPLFHHDHYRSLGIVVRRG